MDLNNTQTRRIVLEMKNISKRFSGIKALDGVNIQVRQNEIHALCGENGAGKSTLMNILSGTYPYGSYEGDIYYEGQPCRFRSIKDSERRGIVIIHQELALVPNLSIAENMFLGNEQKRGAFIDWDATYRKAAEYLSVVGLNENPRTLIKDISVGKQQLVEFAKALAKNVKLLILDEPTSSLNDSDAEHLLDLLIKLKGEGVSSIIISHKLNEISYCADKITIIRDGKTIESYSKEEDISEDRIISGMVGRKMTNRYPPRKHNVGEVSMEIRDWNVYHPIYTERKVVDKASITLRRGEVVGIAGLVGSGRSELCMSVFGHAYGTGISGQLFINGKEVRLNSIPEAIQAGLAYVTEDRKGDGLILSESIRRNITLSRSDFISNHGFLNKRSEIMKAQELYEQLSIKASSIERPVGELSGGNQQKVLLAKWIFSRPEILMMDEPTRGVDVGAKYEIYEIINQLAERGKSVLMVSSELPEILGMCDRIYVMNEGRILTELENKDLTQEMIMGYIMEDGKEESVI